jgi:ubiquinone/menaquinone biosynthesis C-methylase UbiE
VSEAAQQRSYGHVFDGVAEQYDRERPTYPPELVDAACLTAGLDGGGDVLEVGCGTGQLTAALIERGLRVHAIEPGANMARLARRRVGESRALGFQISRFEDALVPEARFDALFSATAFHWVDPQVSWTLAARSLRPGGTLALMQHCAAMNEHTSAEDEEMRAVLWRIAPDIVGSLHRPREASAILAGAEQRRANVSETWSWISDHELTSADAAPLFDDVQVVSIPAVREHSADDAIAVFRTTSVYLRVPEDRREELEAETRNAIGRFGGTIHSTELAILVSARRTAVSC